MTKYHLKAFYFRLLTKLSKSMVLERIQERLVLQAIKEGYIMDDIIAIDATHSESRDQAPPKEDCNQWSKEQAERKRVYHFIEG